MTTLRRNLEGLRLPPKVRQERGRADRPVRLWVLDHDGSEHSQDSDSTIAITPALEAELMAAVQAALAE